MPTDPIATILAKGRLTPEQCAAAVDPAKEVLTLACAGSGKSRTLAFRIARLLAAGEDPKSIVAFTFTEKAAESIKLRVADALTKAGLEPTAIGAMYLGTIHSFCQLVSWRYGRNLPAVRRVG
jgi:DNA helicase-2/ATP-dependent DNA helicase PcrA